MNSNLITRKQLATPIEKILFKREKKKKGLCSSTNVNVIRDKGCGIFPDAGRPEGPGGERGPWSSAGSRTRGRRAAKASVRQLAVPASDAGKSGGGGGLPRPRGSPPPVAEVRPGRGQDAHDALPRASDQEPRASAGAFACAARTKRASVRGARVWGWAPRRPPHRCQPCGFSASLQSCPCEKFRFIRVYRSLGNNKVIEVFRQACDRRRYVFRAILKDTAINRRSSLLQRGIDFTPLRRFCLRAF